MAEISDVEMPSSWKVAEEMDKLWNDMAESITTSDGREIKVIKGKEGADARTRMRSAASLKYSSFCQTDRILDNIRLRSERDKKSKFRDLYSLLKRDDMLYAALTKLRSNKGTSTPGIDKRTIESLGRRDLEVLKQRIINGTFKWKPVAKILIPKPGKNTKKPLGIRSFEDRLLQEMIRRILEQIYEPIFTEVHQNVNFGFRKGKGCHHAIDKIVTQAKGMDWCVEGDIKGAYDNVNHKKLIGFLREKIEDDRFLKLIKDGLECGAIQNGKFFHSVIGTPQGGIASPILFNIYMSKLDEYVMNTLVEEVELKNMIESRRLGPICKSYERVDSRFKYLNKKKRNKGLSQEEEKERRHKEILRLQLPYTDKKRNFVRIVYVRYADDWVLFTNGSKNFTIELRYKIQTFLKERLELELSLEKTKITDVGIDYVYFLGYSFCTFKNAIKRTRVESTQSLKRSTGVNLTPGIDKKRLETRFLSNSFAKKDGTRSLLGCRKGMWSVLQDFEIIQKYNAIIIGLANYYVLVRDASQISYYVYLLTYSCAHTLANKHNLTLSKVFTKFGKKFQATGPTDRNGKKKIYELKSVTDITEFIKSRKVLTKKRLAQDAESLTTKDEYNYGNGGEYNDSSFALDPFRPIVNWRTVYRMSSHCQICGSTDRV